MPRASAGQGSHGCPSESDPARCHRRTARNVGFLQRGVHKGRTPPAATAVLHGTRWFLQRSGLPIID